MENGEKQTNEPEFPLAAYRGLSQTLPLVLEDGQYSEEIVCSTVRILSTNSNPRKMSSMLTSKSEVDFAWDDRYYVGQLLAVHWTGWVLAYVIVDRETRDGAVRVISKKSGGRALIKGMKGSVHDLGFSQNEGDSLLAIVDEFGSLFVYKVDEKNGTLSTKQLFQLTTDTCPKPDYCNRVIWVMYAPEEELEDQRRLALLVGSKALICHIGKLEAQSVAMKHEPLVPSGVLQEALQVIDGHSNGIMDAEFSPDASAIATVSLDGTMQFFQIYMDKKLKCLHNWRPHDGQPLSFFSFLDNHKDVSSESRIWKYVVTGANNNTEFKVWNCTNWSHIQTISMANQAKNVKLKAALDMSASFLVLSDQYNQIIYLYKVCIGKNLNSTHVESVSAYNVPFSILSFVILDVSSLYFEKSDDDSELDDCDDEECENVITLSLYLIHPKSLQECKLQFLPPPTDKKLKQTTLVPDQPELPPPFTLMTPSECASSVEVEAKVADALEAVDGTDVVVSGASSPSQEVCDILNLKESQEAPRSFSADPKIPTVPHNGFELKNCEDSSSRSGEAAKNSPALSNTSFGGAGDHTSVKPSPVHNSLQELQQRVQNLEQTQNLKVIEHLLEEQTNRILSVLERRESSERALQENLLTNFSKTVENLVSTKLAEILPSELKKSITPLVAKDMEHVKRNINAEIKNHLTVTDQLLKENISKLVQNKSVMDSLSSSVSASLRNSLSETCKDLMMNFILPRMEKMLDKTFLQVNDSFACGVRECMMKLREETDKVRDGMKQAENSLRQATDLNKKSLTLLSNEMEKILLDIGHQLQKQLVDSVEKELKGNSIADVTARAMTPAMLTQEKRHMIAQLLATDQYNSAFQEALSASDLNLVVYTCEKIRAEQLFLSSPNCPLQQPVLLSLIQQLTTDLGKHSELKSSYLMEAVLRLEVHHATTREFLPKVISEVEKNISNYLASHPKELKVCNELNRTLMVVKLLHGQINARS